MGAATLAPQPGARRLSLSWWATATALGAVVIVAGTLRFTSVGSDGTRAAAAATVERVEHTNVVPTPVTTPGVAATGTVIGASPASAPAVTPAPSARSGQPARKLRFPWRP
jgi:hypothetical protein